ncbi:MAG: prepilin-type N-terminal cleavage/methylation domain-containing protein [Capsulimonadaceae bacterium]|nr:prepilin-type N-terminal cleavage/methylation domain-containing protein [Capsulimonadaceae bacterium]
MRPTSRAINDGRRGARLRRERSGATMIEMTVVMAILLIAAAAALPRVVAYERSRAESDTEAQIARLPADAAMQAVALGMPVRIRATGSSLVEESVTPDTTGAVTTDSQADQIKEIQLGDDLRIRNAEINGTMSNEGTWEWMVYPDDSSDKGELDFGEGAAHMSLVISDHATSQWISGDVPDQSLDTWDAGSLATRT